MKAYPYLRVAAIVAWLPIGCCAQVNTGSDGHDGAFNPTTNTVVDMADHPDGIYHYTSVYVPTNVMVTFIPNANNTPVVWLVQSDCLIDGQVFIQGQAPVSCQFCTAGHGGAGGPGGWPGGNYTTSGQGPGGGSEGAYGANSSYGTLGSNNVFGVAPGQKYGNAFLIPLVGGSGGGGSTNLSAGGGGGGGAILIAASGMIQLNGEINARGGESAFHYGSYPHNPAGGGSGGAVRLVASRITGVGSISMDGGSGGGGQSLRGGSGRVRFDTCENNFGGWIGGVFTQGFQPIIFPAANQGAQLAVVSVGGIPVSASPTGQLSTPDAVLSAQQKNPIPIVVHCTNIPLSTQITVSLKPANGAAVSATGLNSSGTLASSTATVLVNMPRGGGIIYATAATGN